MSQDSHQEPAGKQLCKPVPHLLICFGFHASNVFLTTEIPLLKNCWVIFATTCNWTLCQFAILRLFFGRLNFDDEELLFTRGAQVSWERKAAKRRYFPEVFKVYLHSIPGIFCFPVDKHSWRQVKLYFRTRGCSQDWLVLDEAVAVHIL